jgi:phosphatidylserine decarboxylase
LSGAPDLAASSARRGPSHLTERLARTLRLAPEGLPFALGPALVGVAMLAAGFLASGVVVLLLALAVGAFFRDPDRKASAVAAGAVIAAADGRVCAIDRVPIPGAGNTPYQRVAVFMSPLNVHVNRAPVSGRIARIVHTPGNFRAAFRDSASESNERNLIEIADAAGRRHAIIQIAGYLARRIVCRIREAEVIERGQRLGLIMFGSRVDHFVPDDYRLRVSLGDRVRAGLTILGEPDDGH